MSKLLKRINLMLIFIITLVACSGCFKIPTIGSAPVGEVELVSTPSTSTVRFMSEGLYIGYLGAQRDFALIVDSAQYNKNHTVQGCGDGKDVGCASTMVKLLMNYGIKTSNFTGESGAQNVLLYYTTADDFASYGDPSRESWYKFFTDNSEKSDFKNDDTILKLSCGTNKEHPNACRYANEMKQKGYSDTAGSAMILLFHNGLLHDVITDKDLDPTGALNLKGTNRDDLVISNDDVHKKLYEEYYQRIIDSLKTRIRVSNATNMDATSAGSEQKITELKTIEQLENLVINNNGDYLLLIVSDGFIMEKIGTNKYMVNGAGDYKSYDVMSTDNKSPEEIAAQKTAMLLFNSVSTFVDNCAVESSAMMNFLKALLQNLVAGSVGALGGAVAGAGIGALIGSVVPGIGTAVGAGVGAAAGAIVGFFAGLIANAELEKKLNSANGISGNNYCNIAKTALDNIVINVPIYTYNIKSANKNITEYNQKTIKDNKLKKFYDNNKNKCLNQYQKVAVPSGLLSFLTDVGDYEYNYADACEIELVKSIVGGFGGSPSLQLYLNGKKADDLHGRITTELITEILYVWGLKSIGDLYTITSNSTLNDMSVVFASAQKVNSMVYCMSESPQPDCSGLPTYNINTNGTNYVGTYDVNKGIKLNFLEKYTSMSKEKTKTLISSKVDSMSLHVINDNSSLTYYSKLVSEQTGWSRTPIITELNTHEELDAILNSIKETLKNNDGSAYQIKYGTYNYIIFGDIVVGYYEDNNQIKITYYSDGIKEYAFAGTGNNFDSNQYFNYQGILVDKNIEVDSAHDFHVYIKYEVNGKTAYYSYVI